VSSGPEPVLTRPDDEQAAASVFLALVAASTRSSTAELEEIGVELLRALGFRPPVKRRIELQRSAE